MVWGRLTWPWQWKERCHKVNVDIDVPQDQNKQQLLIDRDEVEVMSVYAAIMNVDGYVESHDD